MISIEHDHLYQNKKTEDINTSTHRTPANLISRRERTQRIRTHNLIPAERRDERKVRGLDSHTGPEPQHAPWIRGGPWCFRYSVHLEDLYYFHCSIVKRSALSRLASAPLYRKASAPIIVYLCLPLNYSLSTYPPKLVLVLCSCFVPIEFKKLIFKTRIEFKKLLFEFESSSKT